MRVLFDADTVQRRVAELADEVAAALRGTAPVVVGVLNGAAPFMMDLLARLPPDLSEALVYDFVDASSYDGTTSLGTVTLGRALGVDVRGRPVLVVDGIVDTGLTLQAVAAHLRVRGAASVRTCVLLDKPSRRRVDVHPDHCGFCIDDLFVVGYGMDLDQRYRGLRYVGVVEA